LLRSISNGPSRRRGGQSQRQEKSKNPAIHQKNAGPAAESCSMPVALLVR
jgi:hypothetical protein